MHIEVRTGDSPRREPGGPVIIIRRVISILCNDKRVHMSFPYDLEIFTVLWFLKVDSLNIEVYEKKFSHNNFTFSLLQFPY